MWCLLLFSKPNSHHVLHQLQKPLRTEGAHRADFAVAVLCHFDKSIPIVVELRFITVWENLQHSLPAARKAANHIIMGNIMPAALYPVGNT